MWASLMLRPYLEAGRFLVRTDHDCLRWILNIPIETANCRLARWRLRLSVLEFDVAYKPGMTHWLADGMSRLESGRATAHDPQAEKLPVFFAGARAESVRGLDANYVSGPSARAIDRSAVLAAQAEDAFCQAAVVELNKGIRSFFFGDEDGILRRRAPTDGAEQVVIPASLRAPVLELEHDATLAGHPGESRMYASMRRYYYWVGMAADVVTHVRNCESCARGRVRPLYKRSALRLFPATIPFQDIATDLYGPLPNTAAGHEYVMVITDRFSKLTRAVPMGRVKSIDCASVLLDYWIAAYGLPDRILSDGGPQFTAKFWSQVCNLLSVEPKITTMSRPQTDGQTERFNRTMGRILDHYVAEHPATWDQLLGALTLAYNTRPHRGTRVAPLELVNPLGLGSTVLKGLAPRARYPLTGQLGTAAEKRAQAAFLTRLIALVPKLRDAMRTAQLRYKRDHDARLRPSAGVIEAGGFVFKRHHDYVKRRTDPDDRVGSADKDSGAVGERASHKLGHRAQRPYRVGRVEGPTVVIDIDGEHRRENVTHLVRAPTGSAPDPTVISALQGAAPRPSGPSADGHTYAVDRLIDHVDGPNGELFVKVVWTGYAEPTWEPAMNMPHETLRTYLRRAAKAGLPHTSSDPPPGAPPRSPPAAAPSVPPAPRARPPRATPLRRNGGPDGPAVPPPTPTLPAPPGMAATNPFLPPARPPPRRSVRFRLPPASAPR